jgi:hypothetical protein
MKMETAYFPETSVFTYKTTRCRSPKDHNLLCFLLWHLYFRQDEILKSYLFFSRILNKLAMYSLLVFRFHVQDDETKNLPRVKRCLNFYKLNKLIGRHIAVLQNTQNVHTCNVYAFCLPPACLLVPAGSISSTLKMEAICSSESSVATQQTTRHHSPEDDNLQV